MSSARDTGSARTEGDLLITHLDFWQRVLVDRLGRGRGEFAFTIIDSEPIRKRIADTVRPALPEAHLAEDASRKQGIGYYQTLAFKINADSAGGLDLGDGGFTDWTGQLLADGKERCLISCLSTERLLRLSDQRRPPPNRPPSMSRTDPP